MKDEQDPRTTTILLLTHARTASHVLERMLSKQPNVVYGSDWFVTARQLRRTLLKAGPIEHTDPALHDEFMKLCNESYSLFSDFLADAQRQGHIAFAHTQPHAMLSPKLTSEYIYGTQNGSQAADPGPFLVGQSQPGERGHTNPTVLPDSILLRPGTIPILNFRHPMLVCDGVYRGFRDLPAFNEEGDARKLLGVGATLRWQRLMYEWYLEHGGVQGIKPILIDADDYLGPEKELLMRRLCELVPGFDARSVIYKWPKATEEETAALPEASQQAYKTILASEGVMTGYDTRSRTIESEMAKWVEKYGQEEAALIRGLWTKQCQITIS